MIVPCGTAVPATRFHHCRRTRHGAHHIFGTLSGGGGKGCVNIGRLEEPFSKEMKQ